MKHALKVGDTFLIRKQPTFRRVLDDQHGVDLFKPPFVELEQVTIETEEDRERWQRELDR